MLFRSVWHTCSFRVSIVIPGPLLTLEALPCWLERVVFSDARDPLPLYLHGYRTHSVALSAANLRLSLLASCSIPFLLAAVNDIPGAPPGAYWDGGITDYHLHLHYAALHAEAPAEPAVPQGAGLVLYPHFQPSVIPGWLDKVLKHRHRATAHLDNVVLLSPTPQWIRSLPNAKLPDREDFKRYNDDTPGRVAAWSRVVRESERLRDEFAAWLRRGDAAGVEPLR